MPSSTLQLVKEPKAYQHINQVSKYDWCWTFYLLYVPSYSSSVSVRAMQSMLDMTINAKIPDNLVHKLSFERFRI